MSPFLKSIVRVTVSIGFIFLLWGGWYVNRKGFTRPWREFVNSEFEKRGLSVSIGRLTLDPFHGLVAREVEIYDVKSHHRTLAVISQIVLDIDYSKLFYRQVSLNGVDLRNTKLTLPLDPSNPSSAKIVVTKLNARVFLAPHQFYLRQAEADVLGIHVTVTGRLSYPEAFHLDSATGAGGAQVHPGSDLATAIIQRIQALKFDATPPQLDINFVGDARELDGIFMEATLRCEQVRSEQTAGETYRLENVNCVVNFKNGVLDLKKCTLSDNDGTLDANGTWENAAGVANLQLRSTLDVQAFSHAFKLAPFLDEFVFYDPPLIELSGEWNKKGTPAFTLVGRLGLKKFALRSVIFESFNGDFSWDGFRWYARDVLLSHRTGTLAAKAQQSQEGFRAEVQSTLNPKMLLPLMPRKIAEPLSEFDFIDAPKVELTVRGPSIDFDRCVTTGHLKLGRAALRGSQMDSAECRLLVKDSAVTYQQFKIERGDGVATGSFTYDFAKHEIRLEKIKSTINPPDAAPWINPDIIRDVLPYRFRARPNITVDGVVQFAGGKNTNLEVQVDAPGGMDYTFLKKNLSFSAISGRLLFTDGHLRLSDVSGNLFSGHVGGNAEISLERSSPEHSAKIEMTNIDFAKLTKLYFEYDNSHGQLSGDYTFTIRSDNARTMKGSGKLTLTNGNVFSIPFLGPFTGILNSIVPGMGYDVARKATASATVSNGVVETNDFLVAGRGFNMFGKGNIYFLDDRIDFGIRINAHGLPGALLLPVSELFEYVSEGTLSRPLWRPKRLPSLQ